MGSFAVNLYLATYGQKVVSSQYTFTKKSTGNQHLLKDKLLWDLVYSCSLPLLVCFPLFSRIGTNPQLYGNLTATLRRLYGLFTATLRQLYGYIMATFRINLRPTSTVPCFVFFTFGQPSHSDDCFLSSCLRCLFVFCVWQQQFTVFGNGFHCLIQIWQLLTEFGEGFHCSYSFGNY